MVLVEDDEENVHDREVHEIDSAGWEKKEELCIVAPEYRLQVLTQLHDRQVGGHCGRYRMQELVSRNFVQDKWLEDIANYVAGCIRCQKAKEDRHSRQRKLVPMPIGERLFEKIEMDFVGELPESEWFNSILVITGQFTKVGPYILSKAT